MPGTRDLPPLYADWAWISRDETSDGYRVLLESHGAVRAGDFAWDYVPGVPSSRNSLKGPGAPPWFTFGVHPAAGGPVVSASQLYPPKDELDDVGRISWDRLFIACRYGDLAPHQASFQTLAAAMPTALDDDDPRPARLALSAQPLDGEAGLVAAVREFGFDRMALAAAALLDSRQVTITGAGRLGLGWGARLRLLDAALALLPYGFRAAVSASSAIDPTNTLHDIRLVITEAAEEGSRVIVDLGNARRQPPQLGKDATSYLRALYERIEGSGLAAIVAHLWDATDACSLEDPGQAVKTLATLHHKNYLRERIMNGQGSVADCVEYLHDRAHQWPAERKNNQAAMRTLLLTLLQSGAPEAASELIGAWRILLADIGALANDELNRGNLELARQSLAIARHSADPRHEDELLARLLVPDPGEVSKPYNEPISNRVALLRDDGVPEPNALQRTCDVLRYLDASQWPACLTWELLAGNHAEAVAGERTARWARWLCLSDFPWTERECPGWVRALGYTITDVPGVASPDSVEALIARAPQWALVLLPLAAHFQRLPQVLAVPGLDAGLLKIAADWSAPAGAGTPANSAWATALNRMLNIPGQRYGVRASAAGRLDIARLVLGGTPRHFLRSNPGPDFGEYLAGLSAGLDYLAKTRLDRAARITRKLLDWVIAKRVQGPDGRTPGGLAPGTLLLIEAWSREPARARSLATYLAEVLDKTGILRDVESLVAGDFSRQQALPGTLDDLAVELVKEISLDVWSGLMRYDARLVPLGAVKRLEEAMAAVYQDPVRALSRRTYLNLDPVSGQGAGSKARPGADQEARPDGYITNTKPAVAVVYGLYSGLSPRGIVTVIAREQYRAPASQRMPAWVLLGVFLEVRDMITYYQPAQIPFASLDEMRAKEALAQLEWLKFLEQVMGRNAVLGPASVGEFLRENAGDAKDGLTRYRDLRQVFPPRGGPIRRWRAARRHDRWQRRLLELMRGLDQRYLPGRPPPAAVDDAPARAITAGGGQPLPPPAGTVPVTAPHEATATLPEEFDDAGQAGDLVATGQAQPEPAAPAKNAGRGLGRFRRGRAGGAHAADPPTRSAQPTSENQPPRENQPARENQGEPDD